VGLEKAVESRMHQKTLGIEGSKGKNKINLPTQEYNVSFWLTKGGDKEPMDYDVEAKNEKEAIELANLPSHHKIYKQTITVLNKKTNDESKYKYDPSNLEYIKL
jgi:hypothetical protein